jgi:hypothetical protein
VRRVRPIEDSCIGKTLSEILGLLQLKEEAGLITDGLRVNALRATKENGKHWHFKTMKLCIIYMRP